MRACLILIAVALLAAGCGGSDKGLLSADNIVPILRAEVADEELLAALDELSEQLTTEDLIGWNVATDIDKEEPVDVATA